MSRARDLANGITTLAPLASPNFTGDVNTTNLEVGTIKDVTGNTTAMQINSSGHVTRNVIPSWCLSLNSDQAIGPNQGTDLTTVNFADTSATNIFINNGCSVSSGVVTVPTAGLYNVGVNIRFNNVDDGYVRLYIAKNGNTTGGQSAYILVGHPDSVHADSLVLSVIYQITESDITSSANNFRVVSDTNSDTSYSVSMISTFWGYLIG